jgi:hypothetical protein
VKKLEIQSRGRIEAGIQDEHASKSLLKESKTSAQQVAVKTKATAAKHGTIDTGSGR